MPAILSVEEFHAEAANEPQGWIWNRVFPRAGLAFLVGAAYAGKTSLMAMLAASMTDGTPLLGREVALGHILYGTLEHGAQDLSLKLRGVQASTGSPGYNMNIFRSLDLDDDAHISHLNACADSLSTAMIVVDTVIRATTRSENAAESAAHITSRLRLLTGGNRRLVLGVRHFNSSGQQRGSTDWRASADSTVTLRSQGGISTIATEHHSGENVEFSYRTTYGTNGISASEELPPTQEDGAGSDIDLAILRCLASAGPLARTVLFRGHLRPSGVSFENGAEPELLTGLARRELIIQHRKRWQITDAGRAVVDASGSGVGG